MKALFKLNVDCGRSGSLEGIFIKEIERVRALIESKMEVQFGEVLGKHSWVCGSIGQSEIEFITALDDVIDIIERYKLENGFNPFNYAVGEVPDIILDEKKDDWYVDEACDAYIEKTKNLDCQD